MTKTIILCVLLSAIGYADEKATLPPPPKRMSREAAFELKSLLLEIEKLNVLIGAKVKRRNEIFKSSQVDPQTDNVDFESDVGAIHRPPTPPPKK